MICQNNMTEQEKNKLAKTIAIQSIVLTIIMYAVALWYLSPLTLGSFCFITILVFVFGAISFLFGTGIAKS